jgi:excisionase family DNA binding protein
MTARHNRTRHADGPTLTTGQVASLLDVAVRTACKWGQNGEFPNSWRLDGGSRRFPRSDVADFCRRRGIPIPDGLLADPRPGLLAVGVTPALAVALAEQLPDFFVRPAPDGFGAGVLVGGNGVLHAAAVVDAGRLGGCVARELLGRLAEAPASIGRRVVLAPEDQDGSRWADLGCVAVTAPHTAGRVAGAVRQQD